MIERQRPSFYAGIGLYQGNEKGMPEHAFFARSVGAERSETDQASSSSAGATLAARS